jgi:hypothetical protein
LMELVYVMLVILKDVMKMNIKVWWIWEKRKIRYGINNNIVLKVFKRLYNEVEELLLLGLCIGVFVCIMKFIFFLGF